MLIMQTTRASSKNRFGASTYLVTYLLCTYFYQLSGYSNYSTAYFINVGIGIVYYIPSGYVFLNYVST